MGLSDKKILYWFWPLRTAPVAWLVGMAGACSALDVLVQARLAHVALHWALFSCVSHVSQ